MNMGGRGSSSQAANQAQAERKEAVRRFETWSSRHIDHNEVRDLPKRLSDEEIIDRLSG